MRAQPTFASVPYDTKRKVTRRDTFLREMDRATQWARIRPLTAPYDPKAGRGQLPLETLLRVYFLEHWFNRSDRQAEDKRNERKSTRRFARVKLGDDTVPDQSMILRFRHLLEQHQLTAKIFDAVRDLLEELRLLLKARTIVYATIIAAPSSTKNNTETRDPEMKLTTKGQQPYFGLKVRVGTDAGRIVHLLTTTDATTSDISLLSEMLQGHESTRFGDKAYDKVEDKAQWEAAGGAYRINRRGKRSAHWHNINATRSKIRARCEHVFPVAKHLWGFTKVRHRGLAKHTVRAIAAFALADLYAVSHKLSPKARSVGAGRGGVAKRPRGGADAPSRRPRSPRHRRNHDSPSNVSTERAARTTCAEFP